MRIELFIVEGAERTHWSARRDGCDVLTWSGKPGAKGHTKTLASVNQARREIAEQMRAKFKQGWFPLDGELPDAVFVDTFDVAPSDALVFVEVPGTRSTDDGHGNWTHPTYSLRGEVPDTSFILQHESDLAGGVSYEAAGGYSLYVLDDTLYVARGNQARPIEPRLDCSPGLRLHAQFVFRADHGAMLLGVGNTLYEIDLKAATARVIRTYTPSGEVDPLSSRFLYGSEGTALRTWRDELVRIDLATGVETVIYQAAHPISQVTHLADDRLAVVFGDQAVLLGGDDWNAEPFLAFRIRCDGLGTLDGGRVLVVGHHPWGHGTGGTDFYALRDGQWVHFHHHDDTLRACFDARGGQWIELQHGAYKLMNVRSAAIHMPRIVPPGEMLAAPAVVDVAALMQAAADWKNKDVTWQGLVGLQAVLDVMPTLSRTQHQSLLYGALSAGDVAGARAMVAAGLDLDRTSGGVPFLSTSLKNKQFDVAARLVELGARVDWPDTVEESGRPYPVTAPLVQAAHVGQSELVRAMLDAGAAIDAIDDNNYTALGAAVEGGFLELADALVERGASVDGRAESKHPLFCAVKKKRLDWFEAHAHRSTGPTSETQRARVWKLLRLMPAYRPFLERFGAMGFAP